MFNNITAVIFDMDGSMIDSLWVWRDIDREYLAALGEENSEEILDEIQEKIHGMSFEETALFFKKRYSLDASIDKIAADWNQMAFDRYKNEVMLKPGALELIQSCKNKGLKLGIATSNSRELVDMYLEEHGLRDNFQCVMTSGEIKKGKPAPDIYLAVAKELEVDPCECLVFEDIVQGIKAGLNAGMRVCGIDDKYSRYQLEDKRRLAHYIITDFTELL